jgi:hypothetical protein
MRVISGWAGAAAIAASIMASWSVEARQRPADAQTTAKAIRWIAGIGLDSYDYAKAGIDKNGRIRIEGLKAYDDWGLSILADAVEIEGFEETARVTKAKSVTFSGLTVAHWTKAGPELKADTLTIKSPETLSKAQGLPRLRYASVSLSGGTIGYGDEISARFETTWVASGFYPANEAPTSIEVIFNGAFLTDGLNALAPKGHRVFPADTEFRFEGTGVIAIKDDGTARIALDASSDLGRVSASVDLDGVRRDLFANFREYEEKTRDLDKKPNWQATLARIDRSILPNLLASAARVRIAGGAVSLSGFEWLERWTEAIAEASGRTSSAIAAERAKAFISTFHRFGSSDLIARMEDRVSKFLEGSGSLSLTARPQEPVPALAAFSAGRPLDALAIELAD